MDAMNSDLTDKPELQSYDPSLDDPVFYQMDAGKNWTFHELSLDEFSTPTGAKFLLYLYNIKLRELKVLQDKFDKVNDENTNLLVENSKSSERSKLFLLEILGGGLIGYATNLLVPLNTSNPELLTGLVWLVVGLLIVLIIRHTDISNLWERIREGEDHD